MAQDAYAGRGFTLAELMVVLAVLAVTVTMGVPAFAGVVERARVASAYHLLTASLASARLAAVKTGTPVTVCPSRDGSTCRGDLVWEEGWIVYTDRGQGEQPDNVAAVLQRIDRIGAGISIRSTRGRHRVRFTPDGWSYGSNISLRLCRQDSAELLGKVVVNNAGRPRSERAEAAAPCPYAPDA